MKILLLCLICLNGFSQIQVKGIDGKIYTLDTTKYSIITVLPLHSEYPDPNTIILSEDQLEARTGNYNIDSAIAMEVSKIKFSIDTTVLKAYVDIVLNARKSPVPKNQRIVAITGQKVFQFTLPNNYVLYSAGLLLSLDKDYTQSGNVFTLKKAAKKGSIVRLLNLDQ